MIILNRINSPKIKSMVENNLVLSNMINKTIEGLKSEFNILENPMDKYQYIIDIGKEKVKRIMISVQRLI